MTRYRFGEFEFDSAAGRLSANGNTQNLRPKSARLLALLVANRGRVVRREEIQTELWNGSTVSFDNSIEACVRDVRKALGDTAADPVFIRTHPRQGYQFIAAVEETAPKAATKREWRAGIAIAAGCAVALVIAGVFVIGRSHDVSKTGPSHLATTEQYSPPMVAVLPSQKASSVAASQAALASEITIAELTQYAPQLLRVLSAESAAALHRQSPVTHERLSNMGVTHVLWVAPVSSNSGRFNAELTDLSDGGAILSASFRSDDASADALALDIVRVLSKSREIGVDASSAAEENSLALSALVSSDARRDYIWGRNAYYRGDVSRAIEHYQKALRTAPDSSVVLSAYAYALLHSADAEMSEEARATAIRAIELNAANAEALVVLGNLSVRTGELEEARAYFSSAHEIAPGMAQLRHGMAAYHVLADEYDLALREIALAEKLDPLAAPVIGDSAWFFLLAGRFQESLTRCAQLEAILGTHLRVRQCEFNAYIEDGNTKAAAQTAPGLMKLLGAGAAEIARVQDRRPRITLRNYWRWRLSGLGSPAQWSSDDFAVAGRIHAALGEERESVKAFEKAMSEGSRAAPFVLRLKSLRQIRKKIERDGAA